MLRPTPRAMLGLVALTLSACAVAPASDESDRPTGAVASSLCMVGAPCEPPPPVGLAPPTVAEIAGWYAGFDINGDGVSEINGLSLMSFEPAVPQGTGERGVAIVLVDPRLIAQFPKSLANGVIARLTTYRNDLVA